MKRDILRPNFEKRNGLVVVTAQDHETMEILMQAYTDEECFKETLRTGEAVYFSTSRNERWKKGESSGNVQKVKRVDVDCDGDSVIYFVEQIGEGACHTQARSCFFRSIFADADLRCPVPRQLKTEDMLPVIEVEVAATIQ